MQEISVIDGFRKDFMIIGDFFVFRLTIAALKRFTIRFFESVNNFIESVKQMNIKYQTKSLSRILITIY
jgi:hypothetical protein